MSTSPLSGTEAEQLARVSAITDCPVPEIETWVVVVTKPSGLFRVASDMCCIPHTAAMLAQAAADLITDHAAEKHAVTG